jgi:hypothetical protein
MNTPPARTGLPDSVAAAARKAADDLFQALRPAMTTASPSLQVSALWQTVKMLNAVSGGLDFGSSRNPDGPGAVGRSRRAGLGHRQQGARHRRCRNDPAAGGRLAAEH